MAMSGKPFVFMHYSNPTKDSKLTENRQKVAKYAMLGRQRQPAATNGTTGRKNPTSSSTRKTDWSTIQQYSPQDRFETSPDPPSNASTRSTASSISNPSRSPAPSAYSQDAYSQDAYSPPESLDLGPYLGRSPFDPLDHVKPETLEDSNGYVYGNGDVYPIHDLKEESTLLQQPHVSRFNHIKQVNFTPLPDLFGLNNLQQERLAEKRRVQAKRRYDTGRAPAQRRIAGRSVKEDGMSLARVPPFGDMLVDEDTNFDAKNYSPRSLLSATSADPFNTLPIKANAHTYELLYQYMNARLISSVLANGAPETFERIKKMRQSVWWPLCVKSEASLNALVAYVESTPGLPIKSRTRDFLFQHVQASMAAVRDALDKPNVATDDSICFAVVLLMLTAQREGSTQTYATHASGLATLLQYRTDAIRRHGEQDSTVNKLQAFYAGEGSRDRCRYCDSAYDTGAASPTLSVASETHLPTDVDSFNAARLPRGEGFRELLHHGLLSQSMANFIEPAMIWSTLAERARRDKLSAAIGATHAWIDEGEFSLKGNFAPLDGACMTAIRICFYLSSWLDWQHSCPAVRRMSDAVYMVLEKANNIDYLLTACPRFMCWLALMVGPLCDGNARAWFSSLLAKAKDALGLQIVDFDTTIGVFQHLYVWSHTMTPGAEKFWNRVYFIDAQGGCAWGFDGDFDAGVDGGLDVDVDERIWEL